MCQATLQRLVSWESGLLRRMVGVKKLLGETWVGFHKRSARTSRALFIRYSCQPCYLLALERYHRAAGRMQFWHSPLFTKHFFGKAASWHGSHYWKTLQHIADKTVSQVWRHDKQFNGRRARWDNLLYMVYEESWLELAAGPDWAALCNNFVTKALTLCGMSRPRLSKSNARKASRFGGKPPRVIACDATEAPWLMNSEVVSAEVLSDSRLVTTWLLGTARVSGTYLPRVSAIQNRLQVLLQNRYFTTRLPWTDCFRHIFREMNGAADTAAKQALDQKKSFCTYHAACERLRQMPPKYFRVFSDGSHTSGLAGAGWAAYAAWEHDVCDVASLPP